MLDLRTWLFNRVSGNSVITNLVDDRIFSTLDETPETKPFIVIRMQAIIPEIPTAMFQDAVVWVHDDPSSYLVIDSILKSLRDDLDGTQPSGDGIGVTWQGDSVDLSDDMRGTILRTSSYRVAGRR